VAAAAAPTPAVKPCTRESRPSFARVRPVVRRRSQIERIPSNELGIMDDKVSMACMAKKTVYFEVAERKTTGDGAATGPVTAF